MQLGRVLCAPRLIPNGARLVAKMAWKKELAARAKKPPSFWNSKVYSSVLLKSLSRLDDLVDWERSQRTVGENRLMRVSSSPCRELLAALGNPQKMFRSVHVTGSKGKGSVVAMVSSVLKQEGIRVGSFCSPHVSRVNERILLNLNEVSDGQLAVAIDLVLGVRKEKQLLAATWFDVLAAAAFVVMAKAKVEWAVVEVGLGGRLDSTNVLSAEVVVITNIMLEHEAIIGPTRKDIAHEKGGIIRRQDGAVITAVQKEDEAIAAEILRCAEEAKASPPIFVAQNSSGLTIQETNAQIAAEVLDELGRRSVTSKRNGEAISRGMLDNIARRDARRVLKGRMELFRRNGVPIIVDGAHVAESIQRTLVEAHKMKRVPGPLVLVIAIGSDKDEISIAQHVLNAQVPCRQIVTTRIGASPRYTKATVMKRAFRSCGYKGAVQAMNHPRKAMAIALDLAKEVSGYVVISGSLHLAGVMRGHLLRKPHVRKYRAQIEADTGVEASA